MHSNQASTTTFGATDSGDGDYIVARMSNNISFLELKPIRGYYFGGERVMVGRSDKRTSIVCWLLLFCWRPHLKDS
jgi:hypothetical protein